MKRSLLLLPLYYWHNLTGICPNAPTSLEIGTALKQALEQGNAKSADQLSAVNGFFG